MRIARAVLSQFRDAKYRRARLGLFWGALAAFALLTLTLFIGPQVVTRGAGPAAVAQAPPAVTSITPVSRPAAGGTSVGISGTNLAGATGVHFGLQAATQVPVKNNVSVTSPR